jgi:hypothetical protein
MAHSAWVFAAVLAHHDFPFAPLDPPYAMFPLPNFRWIHSVSAMAFRISVRNWGTRRVERSPLTRASHAPPDSTIANAFFIDAATISRA